MPITNSLFAFAAWSFGESAGWPLQQEDPWSAHGGCHQLSVNGKQSKITDDDLLVVADRFAIGTAPRVLREVKSALQNAPLPGF